MQFQAQSKRFAAQKQCFCLERLSAPNCPRTLRSKCSGRSSRVQNTEECLRVLAALARYNNPPN
ncbi:hypothetical protein CJ214_04165 [Peptoniphilus lacrimalis]|nr:hypothetical protein CJ214_04165 [Peptoniphilus lacrimalis]RFT42824.1 hypothetical protein CG396_02245 [Bifidobacteriaceae bacterium N170]